MISETRTTVDHTYFFAKEKEEIDSIISYDIITYHRKMDDGVVVEMNKRVFTVYVSLLSKSK